MVFYKQEELKNKCGIYCILNHISGDVYIGQTSQRFEKRFWHHQWKLKNNSHDNQHLQNAWNLYGEDNFSFIVCKIIDINSNNELHEQLNEFEIKYINIYRAMNHCYNIIDGGQGRSGVPLTEEHKRKIGETNRKILTGKKHTEKTKQKMSETRKGHINLNSSNISITPDQAYSIKTRLMNNEKPSEIAKDMNISYKVVNGILSNNTWATVFVEGWEDYRKSRKTHTRLTKQDHQDIYNLYVNNGLSKYELADKYNKGVKMIEKILRDYRQ